VPLRAVSHEFVTLISETQVDLSLMCSKGGMKSTSQVFYFPFEMHSWILMCKFM